MLILQNVFRQIQPFSAKAVEFQFLDFTWQMVAQEGEGLKRYVATRGTSIQGEVRNVEKKGLLSSFYVVNLMIF